MRTRSGKAHGEVLQYVVRGVGVERIAAHLAAVDVLAGVVHERHRKVALRLVGTSRHAHRVRLAHRIGEKEVEPVGVAELGLLQVGVACGLGVLQAEGARRRIVAQLLEHVAIDTRVRGIGQVLELEPALVGHLLIDAHHLLRVHDVIVAIRGLQAGGELARIVERGTSLLALLGGDDNHTSHGARTINRGSGTVLEHGERLDVVRVQTSHSRRNQRLGIARRKFVGGHIHVVLINHTVDDPQRLRVAVNRCGTTDTDLGSCTERTAHVCHLHTGHAAFERTTHVVGAGLHHGIGLQVGRCTGKHSLIDLAHTGDDHLFDDLFVRLERNREVRLPLEGNLLCPHTDVRNLQRLGVVRNTKAELAIDVGRGTRLRALDDNRSTDNGLVVLGCNDSTCHLSLRHHHREAHNQSHNEG